MSKTAHVIEEVVEYDTFEEAFAEAARDAGPNGVVTIHAEDCAEDDDEDSECTCVPIVMQLGARA